MKAFIILVPFLFLLSNCEPLPEDAFKRSFLIRKGDHYSQGRTFQFLQSEVLRFTAEFDESAIYHFDEKGFQDSKNKLLGFSDCNSAHHENSARFAWQWYNDQLEIYAYCYVKNVRVEKFLGVATLGTENLFEIELTDDSYVFRFNNGEPTAIPRASKCDRGLYYMLWPYFGGSLPAPHDVRIQIGFEY